MILVDREIADRITHSELIENADSACITNIGYDLRAEYFVVSETKETSVWINPGDSAFVAAKENIRLPDNMLAKLVLKNSRLRQGLSLDAPVYQPGHHTKVFFRVTNLSANAIALSSGEQYATILFEELPEAPEKPYAGAFIEELSFSGMGDYRDIYQKQIKQIEQQTEDLKHMERSIYANVLVILTVFVALFSFITTDISLLSQRVGMSQFLICNFVMLGCVSFLAALLNSITGIAKGPAAKWLPCVISFAVALLVFFLR